MGILRVTMNIGVANSSFSGVLTLRYTLDLALGIVISNVFGKFHIAVHVLWSYVYHSNTTGISQHVIKMLLLLALFFVICLVYSVEVLFYKHEQ